MNEALELLSADLLRSNCMQPFPKHVYQRFRLCALIDLERTRTTAAMMAPIDLPNKSWRPTKTSKSSEHPASKSLEMLG